MWNDNETDIDLLGFDHLVDSLDILLRQEELLPLTIGVLGDWGSGKSSLMRLAKANLDAPPPQVEGEGESTPSPFITVSFSPWRFEDFTQVKVALMDAVIGAIEERIKSLPEDAPPKNKLARAKEYLGHVRRLKPLAGPAAAGAATGLGALVGLPLPPEVLALVGAAATVTTRGDDAPGKDSSNEHGGLLAALAAFAGADQDALKSISDFHVAFEDLLNSIEDVQAVVVFIDDMDRCEERAIIDTFETIRLFLNAKKTAYVLGVNEQIVISALEDRYPNRGGDLGSRAQQYLEKMMQASVAIPRLSEAEARSYISLLYASKHLDTADFEKLVEKADERRSANPYAEAMNIGVAQDALGDGMSDELRASLEIAAAVGGPLADGLGLRGNPRQLKRFLNKLELRLALAQPRDADIDPKILAKLMVLEELSFPAFEQLFVWQADNDGVAPHLTVAEAEAHKTEAPKVGKSVKDDTRPWASQPVVRSWLDIEPRLAGVALAQYFTLSRDSLKMSLKTSSLTVAQQDLLAKLRWQVDAVRQQHVRDSLQSPEDDLLVVASLLLKDYRSAPASPGAKSLVDLAAGHDGIRTDFFTELAKLPARSLTTGVVLDLSAKLGTHASYIMIAQKWRAALKPESAIAKALDVQLKKASA